MKPADFDFLSQIVRKRSGLVLSADKSYLLESRLTPVARQEGHDDLAGLVAAMRKRPDERLAWSVTEAMTTNETFFFRDKTPFDTFKDVVVNGPMVQEASTRPLRIWCAACSTGQEPYSLAMILDQASAKLRGRRVEILATDICSKALEKAKAGVYSQFEVQRGLPVQFLVKYFEKVEDLWRIRPDLQRTITFKKFNLLDNYAAFGKFDVIFCRNVLIYFDQPTKSDILNRLARASQPDSYLFLGAAETVLGLTDSFASVKGQRGLYHNTAGAKAAA